MLKSLRNIYWLFCFLVIFGLNSCSENQQTEIFNYSTLLNIKELPDKDKKLTTLSTAYDVRALNRFYYDGMHIVTSSLVADLYKWCSDVKYSARCSTWTDYNNPPGGLGSHEKTLGYLLSTQKSNTSAIYHCYIISNDRIRGPAGSFLSKDSKCEGKSLMSNIGYLYDSKPANPSTVPIYRCLNGTNWLWLAQNYGIPDHFATNDPNCEGRTSEGLLGYALQMADDLPPTGYKLLRRYYNWAPNIGDHWVTTGSVDYGYYVEVFNGTQPSDKTSVFLRENSTSGSVSLYSCRMNNDHFLSRQSNCEGQVNLGSVGYIDTSNTGPQSHLPIYRCYTGYDHFASTDSQCEKSIAGNATRINEGLLGYGIINP